MLMERKVFEVVVLGDGGVGKTALTIQFCFNHFVETYDPTIEDSYRREVMIEQIPYTIEILDTAGQEEYSALGDQRIRDGDGFILVYSITSRRSFQNIRRLYKHIQLVEESTRSGPRSVGNDLNNANHPLAQSSLSVPVTLLGNKSDISTDRVVATEEGQGLANELECHFFETSAKNRINVEMAFHTMVQIILEHEKHIGRWDQNSCPSVDTSDFVNGSVFHRSFKSARPGHLRTRGRHRCILL